MCLFADDLTMQGRGICNGTLNRLFQKADKSFGVRGELGVLRIDPAQPHRILVRQRDGDHIGGGEMLCKEAAAGACLLYTSDAADE